MDHLAVDGRLVVVCSPVEDFTLVSCDNIPYFALLHYRTQQSLPLWGSGR